MSLGNFWMYFCHNLGVGGATSVSYIEASDMAKLQQRTALPPADLPAPDASSAQAEDPCYGGVVLLHLTLER